MHKDDSGKVNWFEGVEADWREFKSLYARMLAADEKDGRNERKRLRRRAFYSLHRAISKARFKGRLLGVLGDVTDRPDHSVQALLKSYSISRTEGDLYNCLLVADSLVEFYIEKRYQPRRARHWMRIARRLLERFGNPIRAEHLESLARLSGRLVVLGRDEGKVHATSKKGKRRAPVER